jgi:hypothetical protein
LRSPRPSLADSSQVPFHATRRGGPAINPREHPADSCWLILAAPFPLALCYLLLRLPEERRPFAPLPWPGTGGPGRATTWSAERGGGRAMDAAGVHPGRCPSVATASAAVGWLADLSTTAPELYDSRPLAPLRERLRSSPPADQTDRAPLPEEERAPSAGHSRERARRGNLGSGRPRSLKKPPSYPDPGKPLVTGDFPLPMKISRESRNRVPNQSIYCCLFPVETPCLQKRPRRSAP